MGVQYQLHTEADSAMVPGVKPKELCYLTEPRIFFPLTEVCNANPCEWRPKAILLC